MIKDFAEKKTAAVFRGWLPKGFPADMANVSRRKLRQLDNASSLQDMRAPPGNRLEALKRRRAGQHSVRINDQWRVCFRWKDGDAYEVEVTDYHDG